MRCPQTFEFGNTGCVEIVGRVFGPDGQLATPAAGIDTVLTVRAQSVEGSRSGLEAFQLLAAAPAFRLRLTRYSGSAAQPDTTTVWVVGLLLDKRNATVGHQPRVLAADSTTRRITLVPVGARFYTDTVDLRLRMPSGIEEP